MSPPATPHGVLFVCLGNICRSPLAEAIFLHAARQRDVLHHFHVDSCGTGGWHAGEGADPRSLAVAARNGVPMVHVARQLDIQRDAARYATIIAMDRSNRRGIVAAAETAGISVPPVRLMLEFATSGDLGEDVPDPYYGGDEGFQRVFEMLDDACAGLLDQLVRQRK